MARRSYDEVPAQLEKAKRLFVALGCPAASEEVIADLAELVGCDTLRIATFFRYGHLN